MDEDRKELIIRAGIVERADWETLAPEHIQLADSILKIMEIQQANPDLELFSDEYGSMEEQAEEFLRNAREFNDSVELEQVDRVQPDKDFKEGMPIAIPMSLIPFFNKIFRDSRI